MASARPARKTANLGLEEAVADAEARYVAARPKSRAIFEQNLEAMPGGNTRTVLFFQPFPTVLAEGRGARLVDVDGHDYVDWLGEYSAGLYGHSHPVILGAIQKALEAGIALGGPNRFEGPLAAELCRRFPSLELVRFCNSGTEANLFAISAARAYTGRPAVMVFDHGYHGGVFYFAPGGDRINAPFPWVLAPYNDLPGTLALLEAHADELAAVLIEPVQGGAGALPAEPGFLQALREACTRFGICLIFDEVMTSRSSAGGLQARLGITPDLTTLGKYLGGGLTLSAFGGKAAIMAQFDPRRPQAIPHAGTFNNNVLAMAAGLAGLQEVATPAVLDAHFQRGERLKEKINALAERRGVPFQCTGCGTILALHCQGGTLRSGRDLAAQDPLRRERLQRLLHFDLLERGHYLARRGYLALSLPLREEDETSLLGAIDEFLALRRHLLLA
ncbi:MAG: aminotransferase class III-fold pyridoxal phosphate-dependent enzyme [Geminicoccaceae bacterium]|nr:aminotransferase class III-fold pyridoxal phosphate-dependent enzyme [Geminicoccaceae bacterium]MDW8368832.1 aminotransferase class III-fold pyridoxal phosphate-dependent enzyme [Geminicoccaceae bacterium]